MNKPNFLVIGAAKSGTTALYVYLKQHPQIYMSDLKEPHFFSYEGQTIISQGPNDYLPKVAVTDWQQYLTLFTNVTNEVAIGEASPTYLYIPQAVQRIQHHLPHAKLIAILRHPAERAFSAYMHVRRDKRETIEDFGQALEAEQTRVAQQWGPIWHYQAGGFYYTQLKRYVDVFPAEKLKVYLYDDLKADPHAVLQGICTFLEVDSQFTFDVSTRPNVSGLPKNKGLQTIIDTLFQKQNPIRWVSRRLLSEEVRLRFTATVRHQNLQKQVIPPDIRRQLTHIYRDDILQLQELIQRDLSHWLA